MEYSHSMLAGYAVIGVILGWIFYRIFKKNKVDNKFKCKVSGGRSGEITIGLDGKNAKCEIEVGYGADFIIYESSLAWSDGSDLNPTEKESLEKTLSKWSSARGSSIEIANDT